MTTLSGALRELENRSRTEARVAPAAAVVRKQVALLQAAPGETSGVRWPQVEAGADLVSCQLADQRNVGSHRTVHAKVTELLPRAPWSAAASAALTKVRGAL